MEGYFFIPVENICLPILPALVFLQPFANLAGTLFGLRFATQRFSHIDLLSD